MSRNLKSYLTTLVTSGVILILVTSVVVPVDVQIRLGVLPVSTVDTALGLVFWTVVTLIASALPVTMGRGTVVNTSIAPLVAVLYLGGPAAAAIVATLGVTEIRELRGRVPWYGTAANHIGVAVPAILGAFITHAILLPSSQPIWSLIAVLAGGLVLLVGNMALTAVIVALRRGESITSVLVGDLRQYAIGGIATIPLAWLMAQLYQQAGIGWWAVLLVVLPVYVIRLALHQVVEMREMFTQTVGALAQAVDARDAFTSGHSERVQLISVDMGNVMRLKDDELQALEWGGLLHDIGKIGVPDSVLLKQDKLTRDERALMNRHPVIGANIIAHVGKLAPELPIIRHHHEWYNGSGYPDRLMGDEIPKLARVLHVADAFEAMTSARPYRMRPLSREQAIAELRKYAGVQFDPVMVDAFVRTSWAKDVADAGRPSESRPVPLLAQAAARMIPPPAPGGPPADAS
jgi:HD-GYP domain-containing protein (c-di-GMP phosphodiesterase class II)